ncbi:MAG: c-type cytochrome, partial [Planctomycetes bacterium]|nr:c-type cytochrome [Planctomycetota bacterium]
MMVRLSKKRTLVALGITAPVWLALLFLAGCEQDQYPEDMTYPLRSDPLIKETPTDAKDTPVHFDTPGEFPDQWLAFLSSHNAKIIRPVQDKKRDAKQLQDLEKALNQTFGTPAHPKIGNTQELSAAVLQDIQSDIDDNNKLNDQQKGEAKDRATNNVNQFFETMTEPILAHGSQLYRRHCLQCHGLTGDGRGHTAPWINPHPRDFRRGMFKFTSSTEEQGAGRKARREDLLRTLHVGIEGTAMPSFGLLPDTELEDLASYVIHLSLRGEAEAHAMFDDLEAGMSMDDALKENLQITLRRWVQTEADVIFAAQSPSSADERQNEELRQASVIRGHDFFMA